MPARAAQPTDQTEYGMGYREESSELRRQRLGTVVRELAADLVEERRRRLGLEREVRKLLARLAAYEASESSGRAEHHA
jgi:hypothetical protein